MTTQEALQAQELVLGEAYQAFEEARHRLEVADEALKTAAQRFTAASLEDAADDAYIRAYEEHVRLTAAAANASQPPVEDSI